MTNINMPVISYSAYSCVGLVRSNNEDNLYCGGSILTPETRGATFAISGKADTGRVFAVCDGMGGHADGEFASYTAVNALGALEASLKSEPVKIDALVQDYVARVNNLLCDKMREKSVRTGTTLALVIVSDDAIKAYSIGDSRIYEMTGATLRQLSGDHTLAAQKVKMGVITEEQARNDSDRHKLTRYLGVFEDEMIMEAESLPALPLSKHRRLLLCSDGLTDLVPDSKIENIMRNSGIDETAGLLAKAALENGGKDNITCVIVDIKPNISVENKITRLFSSISGHIGKKYNKRQVSDDE